MRNVDFEVFYSRVLTLVVLTTLITAFSMVSLASPKPVGELIVRPVGTSDSVVVTVDGEKATSGRTLFASSVISTPEQYGATLNLGKLGKLELGTSTKFTLALEGSDVVGYLNAGSITAYGNGVMAVETANGSVVRLNSGETVDSNSSSPGQKSSSSFPAWGWAVIIGIAVGVAVIAVVASSGNDNNTVSPVR